MKLTVNGVAYAPGRVFCVGMNYEAHIRELKNETPESPVIFLKPASCLVAPGAAIAFPAHGRELHYEAEVVALIGRPGRPRTDAEARAAVAGLTLGLDLTMRDVQRELRRKGHPWEASKAFEQSAPLGRFVPAAGLEPASLEFECRVNGQARQRGNTSDMVFSIPALIVALGRVWELQPGDLLYTGTPEGVGPLAPGDRVEVTAPWAGTFGWTIAA